MSTLEKSNTFSKRVNYKVLNALVYRFTDEVSYSEDGQERNEILLCGHCLELSDGSLIIGTESK